MLLITKCAETVFFSYFGDRQVYYIGNARIILFCTTTHDLNGSLLHIHRSHVGIILNHKIYFIQSEQSDKTVHIFKNQCPKWRKLKQSAYKPNVLVFKVEQLKCKMSFEKIYYCKKLYIYVITKGILMVKFGILLIVLIKEHP